MWWQHIPLSNSRSSRCPSWDQHLLLCWKMWSWRFWQVFRRVGWGLVARRDFFACNGRRRWWCTGTEGIGWMGRHSHRRQGLHSSHTTFHRGWSHSFLTHVEMLYMMTLQNLEQSVQHVIFTILKAKYENKFLAPCKNSGKDAPGPDPRIRHRIQIGMFRPIRVDHTNCLQVAIKTHSFTQFTTHSTPNRAAIISKRRHRI